MFFFDNTREPKNNAWQGSDAQSWCTDFYNGNTFDAKEKTAILATIKSDTAYANFGAISNILNGDNIFFLSGMEVEQHSLSSGNNRIAEYNGSTVIWWLRSGSASNSKFAGIVPKDGGAVNIHNLNNSAAARPAFNLDTSKVLFSTAAVSGKECDGTTMTAVPTATPTEWKLTLKDDERSGFNVTETTLTAVQGETKTIAYEGAKTGANEYVSAMISSGNNVLYYGRLANNSASGSTKITIPSNLAAGDYTLKVFNEQYNGDNKTDYASDFKDIALTVTPAAPTFAVPAGVYETSQSVVITSATADTAIYYTTDGSEPTTSSTLYSSAITVSSAQTIKAIAVKNGIPSTVSSAMYRFRPTASGAFRFGTNGIYGGGTNYIYYGNSDGSGIKWRVLDEQTNMGTSGFFLISENALTADDEYTKTHSADIGISFDNEREPCKNVYQGSSAQKWCANFYVSDAFGEKERAEILKTTKADDAVTLNGYTYGTSALNNDNVFFLSAAEADSYFSGANDRIATYKGSAAVWWLRSPNAGNSTYAGLVGDSGGEHCGTVERPLRSARPAFNLDTSKVLFSTNAGGKASLCDDKGTMTVAPTATPTEWKLTLKDDERSGFNVTETTLTAVQGETKTIAYEGAKTGANEYVSAMICDGDNVLYYGRLANNSASGSTKITIPSNLAAGDYTLKVFNEQYNGNAMTDYSSAFKNIQLTVTPALVFNDSADFDIPEGTVGETYTASTALTATGGTGSYTFTIDPAVTGLSVNGNNMLVYSRPTIQDSTTATVKVTDSGTPAQTQTITIDIGAVTATPVTTHTITASATTGGTITPSGTVFVNDGANKTFTIAPNANYSIASVTVDGENKGAISTYTFANVIANHRIEVEFIVNTVQPTAKTTVEVKEVTSYARFSSKVQGFKGGWDGVKKYIANMKPGDSKEIVMSSHVKLIPRSVIETIKGKDVTITFISGNDKWTVNGKDIKTVNSVRIDKMN